MSDKPTNKEFAAVGDLFRKACTMAGIEPTARQASKWRRGFGLAYQTYLNNKKALKGGQS